MDRMPTDRECAIVKEVVEAATKQRFPEAEILGVKVEGLLDRYNHDPYYHVHVVCDTPSGELDSEKTISTTRNLRPKLEEAGLLGCPVVIYIPKKYGNCSGHLRTRIAACRNCPSPHFVEISVRMIEHAKTVEIMAVSAI